MHTRMFVKEVLCESQEIHAPFTQAQTPQGRLSGSKEHRALS
ncbi:hypothetical protein Mrub_2401 [Meiothermus ruber DSM 1279]|jgi:hypothetical protein|uniref:Uncharacterized protein n=1 Tax=Meiothermus ruber (strain ATCC 35948 / DSM 1279 / VKM B-1258 / 21) TaxID=504728 RepID=A0A806CSH8_MEIRD|nr:hypothetical protein Mrub_2401 [Meiothermus ruber DSM 1279]